MKKVKLKAKPADLSDIFVSLPDIISGQEFKDMVRGGWEPKKKRKIRKF